MSWPMLLFRTTNSSRSPAPASARPAVLGLQFRSFRDHLSRDIPIGQVRLLVRRSLGKFICLFGGKNEHYHGAGLQLPGASAGLPAITFRQVAERLQTPGGGILPLLCNDLVFVACASCGITSVLHIESLLCVAASATRVQLGMFSELCGS